MKYPQLVDRARAVLAEPVVGSDWSDASVSSLAVDADAAIQSRSELAGAPAPFSTSDLHGPVGEWVAEVEKYTEASVAGLYISALVGLSALIGRGPHVCLDGARHGVNLFGLLVGPTGTARKGTAWAHARRLLHGIDAGFLDARLANGLSSGQGVIHHLRDADDGDGADGRAASTGADKRLLIVEPEFAGTLRQMNRDGNTLSAVLREGWDGNTLRTLTRNNPLVARDPHLAILGHITPEELKRSFAAVDATNGFANRFLFFWCERARVLPFGGEPDANEEKEIVARLADAVRNARETGLVELQASGREWWQDHYEALSSGSPGLVGSVTDRATAQVRRIAALFTVLDGRDSTGASDLEAALTVCEYGANTARFLFGRLGLSAHAVRAESSLLDAGAAGLTRTEIRKIVFRSNNVASAKLSAVANELVAAGIIHIKSKPALHGPASEFWIHVEHSE
jgi:hypothetical protein